MNKWILIILMGFFWVKTVNAIDYNASIIGTNNGPILSIVPTSFLSSQTVVTPSISETITYTVTNTSGVPVSHLVLDPGFVGKKDQGYGLHLLNITITNNTCPPVSSLNVNASCTFTLNITGTGNSGVTTLMPRVCISSGAACSNPIASNRMLITASNLYIGEHYRQGMIYCLGLGSQSSQCAFLPAGAIGEIMTLQDENIAWDPTSPQATTGATDNNNGILNTNTIINVIGNSGGASNAAYFCKHFSNNANWYLPAINELLKIGANQTILNANGANLNGIEYWSSTEQSQPDAYTMLFNGSQFNDFKSDQDSVRCVSSFNS